MITFVLLLFVTVSAGMLTRKAARRGWRLHAVVAGLCTLVLAVVTGFLAVGDLADLPVWLPLVGAATNILFIAVVVDVSRAEKRDKAVR